MKMEEPTSAVKAATAKPVSGDGGDPMNTFVIQEMIDYPRDSTQKRHTTRDEGLNPRTMSGEVEGAGDGGGPTSTVAMEGC